MNLGNRTVSEAYFSGPHKSGRDTTEIHTHTNDEAANAYARDDILDEEGLAGTNKCGSLTVVFVIVGRSRDTVDPNLAIT